MGHRNPNHKGILVVELNIKREEGYLYFCLGDKSKDNKIQIYRSRMEIDEKIKQKQFKQKIDISGIKI